MAPDEENSNKKTEEQEVENKDQHNDNSKPKELIKDREIEEEMKKSYMEYAMSVIVARALPDVRDGLKPVHRRILFAMNDLGMLHNKPFKKSARIVGEVLGKYHPHGDSAVYDSMVRMAQPFSLRYMLIDGQGNFGSVDGDNAAAMRYTEARLKRIAEEMLQDIDKNTVEFTPNFDESLKEPSVLPAKVPNLLINGSSGIAVGMATNIPPHNLKEIAEGVIAFIENPEIEINELIQYVKGPDFPTGAIICGRAGIKRAYQTGKGHIRLRAKTEVEEGKKNKIIIKEIPYQVNKSLLVEEIANLVRDKRITGISDIRDESDKEGMRIVIELKKDESPEIIQNQLFKHSRLQTTFGVNMLSLVKNEPKTLNLKQMINEFVKHRQIIVRKRTEFELDKAQKRAHILEGLLIALDDIDNAISLIKKSKTAEIAKNGLISNYKLTEIQAQAILDMKLQRLTSLETDKIRQEHKELMQLIEQLKAILASEQKILSIIKEEQEELIKKYGDERRTTIEESETDDIEIEDLIKEEDMVVTISHAGYVKRLPIDTYKQQRRGGKGIIGATTKEEDFIEKLFIANTHAYLLFFTDKGQVYWLKVYSIPEASRQAKGKALVNLITLAQGEKINAILPVKDFNPEKYIVMATQNGVIKKTNLAAYSRPRQGGIIAINLDEGDQLIGAIETDGYQKLILATQNGIAVKFDEEEARAVGRASRGSRGINLRQGDKVIGLVKANDEKTLLTLTENGYGKRTKILEYRQVSRGSKGVINIICSERNGKVAAVRSVVDEDEIMAMTQKGITIRIPASQISTIGRNTQGMRIMRLSTGDKVAAVAKIVTEEQEKDVQESD